MDDKQNPKFFISPKWAILIVFLFLIFFHSTANSQEIQVKIGVLALRGAEETLQRWTPTAEYLSAQIPEYRFVIIPLDFEEIYDIVGNGEVDFVLTNSGIYIELEYMYGIDRIVTLKDLWKGQAFSEFGGVIFIRKDRTDINTLDDLKNKTFMGVHETSLGGWRMAQRELIDYGIDPYKDFADIQFGGTQDMVVYAVQNGRVDAGTIRTGILEKMDEEGKIDINDFTVLNQQQQQDFSLLLSTRLYPEWPFARVHHELVSDHLAQQVSIALLSMPSDSQAALSANIAGWTIPHNYQLVHDCYRELRVSPYEELGKITLPDLIQQYWGGILGGFIGVIGLVAIIIYINGLNSKLSISTAELEESRKKLEQRVKERTRELRTINQQLELEITESKQAKEKLIGSESKFRLLADHTHDWEYWRDPDGNYTYISPACERITGYSSEEIASDPNKLFEMIRPDHFEEVQNHYKNENNKETLFTTIEFPIITRDGEERWLGHTCFPIFDQQGDFLGRRGNNRDITEHKKVEEELTKYREHLEEMVTERTHELAEVNKELDDFAHIISHDLKAPLRGISQLAGWIVDDYFDMLDVEGKEQLGLLIGRTKQMHNMIDDILQYSRAGRFSEEARRVALDELVREIMESLAPPEHIQISIEDELPTVVGEQTRLIQVFQNLLSNAVNFMDKPEGLIQIKIIDQKSDWQFSIADNGPGIEEQFYEKIFGVFQTLAPRDQTESTGIGLAVVKKIVEDWGGKIWLESLVGQGSTFYFTLPKKEMKNEK